MLSKFPGEDRIRSALGIQTSRKKYFEFQTATEVIFNLFFAPTFDYLETKLCVWSYLNPSICLSYLGLLA